MTDEEKERAIREVEARIANAKKEIAEQEEQLRETRLALGWLSWVRRALG